MYNKTVNLHGKEFIFQSEKEPKSLEFRMVKDEEGLSEYELYLNLTERDMSTFSIKWSAHMQGILSCWTPIAKRDREVKQWFGPNTNFSNIYYGAPILSVIDQGDKNFSTVAVSDAVNPVRMTFAVNDFEEKENLDFHIYLFEEGCTEESYTIRIRIDERDIPYYDAIASVSNWWKEFYPIDRIRTENGELPLYSTWYNYHQNPTQESLEKEMAEAVKCGFKSLIIDDGWSYEGVGTGDYCNCGNWNVTDTKFPDFGAFVKYLHELGIKAAVWFPVPYVGYYADDYKKFQGKILYNSDGAKCGVLDPRYPDVRKYIVDNYVDMVNKYELDGLKLDFIDAFRCPDRAALCTDKSEGYDCDKVEEGVTKLLREIRETLTAGKEDFMIEFRQFYVGPAIVRECNMLRVIDCAFDCITNRVGIADLRLLNYGLAVHADMLLWSQDEKSEVVAKMLLNTMFAVPQISVLLQNSSDEQKKIITSYISYWYENKEVLLYGHFKAHHPEACYSLISSENDEKRVVVAYSENSVCFDGKTTDIFNATASDYLYIENTSGRNVNAVVYDCCGNKLDEYVIEQNVCKVSISEGGKLSLSKNI